MQHKKNNPTAQDANKKSAPGKSVSDQPEHTSHTTGHDDALRQQHYHKPAGFKTGEHSSEQQKQHKNDEEQPEKPTGEGEEELPSREKEDKPYVGDNPEETRRQTPKMEA